MAQHYYSVPYPLIKQLLSVRLTANTVECFHQGQRVASHVRCFLKGKQSTLKEHMPKAHQHYSEWNSERFLNWALRVGPHTRDVIAQVLSKTMHPEQSYRSCFGILTSEKRYSATRLEAACQRALAIGAPRRHTILSILKRGLEQQPLTQTLSPHILHHENIRGATHYQEQLAFTQHKP